MPGFTRRLCFLGVRTPRDDKHDRWRGEVAFDALETERLELRLNLRGSPGMAAAAHNPQAGKCVLERSVWQRIQSDYQPAARDESAANTLEGAIHDFG